VVSVNQLFIDSRFRSLRNKAVWVEQDTSTAVRTGENELTIYAGPGGHYAWIPDPDSLLEVFAQSAGEPQNPLSPTESIQDGINRAGELLANQRCIDFINSLLQRAAAVIDSSWWGTAERYTQTGGVYSGVNVVNAHNTYADLFAAGGVTSTGVSGHHGNKLTYGQTDPSNLRVSWNSEFFGLSRDDRGLHTLHEYLHQFRGFNDEVLANAARFVAGQSSKDFSQGTDPVGAASRNLNDLIREHCAP
jgi:hypothetical protein